MVSVATDRNLQVRGNTIRIQALDNPVPGALRNRAGIGDTRAAIAHRNLARAAVTSDLRVTAKAHRRKAIVASTGLLHRVFAEAARCLPTTDPIRPHIRLHEAEDFPLHGRSQPRAKTSRLPVRTPAADSRDARVFQAAIPVSPAGATAASPVAVIPDSPVVAMAVLLVATAVGAVDITDKIGHGNKQLGKRSNPKSPMLECV